MNKDKEFLIEGRENKYKLKPQEQKFVVYIKYKDKKQWALDDKFESIDTAICYINSCLAYESDGLAWKFQSNNVNF